MPLVFFQTFGCQMNVADADALAAALLDRGFAKAETPGDADLIVVNTCSVRERAEQRARARIAELSAHKARGGKERRLWVMGCMAQRLGAALKREYPAVDLIVGARDFERFVTNIDSALENVPGTRASIAAESAISRFVPIMRGCDNCCSYCVVPQVRGPEVSLPADSVEETVRSLVDKGVCEVTLLGQNVNSYRDGDTDFPQLLCRLHDVKGLARIRFTTSHPKDCSEDLIRAMAELPKLCKHIHLPVQSGSTRVLSLMNRGYSRDDYLSRIDMIRARMPDADITTDAMVGFPTETDVDYEDTLSLFDAVRFTTAFMFAYSRRDNTAAASMAGDIAAHVKQERLARLIRVQTAITKETYGAAVGRELPVLLTGRQEGNSGLWMGQDMGCKKVLAACKDCRAGTILPLRIVKSTGKTLIGERT
ncbi:MAG TPA: tRNA (N6-isopentenyl adenosine(37)-C2)-methylthiotransferase MiaB [Chitinivibrionales bacterium]|jgi:tRNA-2-methylthio-N6-dimethylallyladenosine synthase|nr:tRNA (N6-isopentenyl adenosine(37)-C2)-methylthiotransferase MiaB [Chitinivibrionales bacterium]